MVHRTCPPFSSNLLLLLSTPAEVCAGCSAGAAGRDSVPLPVGGGGSHLRMRGRDNGGGRAKDGAAHHEAAGQHEP